MLALLLATNFLSAQEYSFFEDPRFAAYAAFVSERWDITCQMPEEFKDVQVVAEGLVVKVSGQKRGNDMVYCPVLQSESEDCLLMYALATVLEMIIFKDSTFDNPYDWPQSQIIGELETALGLSDTVTRPCCCQKVEPLIAFDDYVTTLTGKEAKDLFNVDRVYFYDLPFKQAYKEKYAYGLGMVLAKKDRPDMFLKLCFTENGVKEKAQYVRMLKGKIWYEDGCSKK